MLERLQKVMARGGVGSRRYCETLIEGGRVRVNGKPVTEPGTKVDPAVDEVVVDGNAIQTQSLVYFLLFKPAHTICSARPENGRPSALALVPTPAGERVFCVGRLDDDSEGALILTNDGEFCNLVTHPRYGVEKTYRLRVRGRASPELLEKVRKGVHLAEGRTAPARVNVVKRGREMSILHVTLREGKNRHLRRVFAKVGLDVQDLLRTHIGDITLGRLKVGEWRPLSRQEIEGLKKLATAGPRVPRTRVHAPRRAGPTAAPASDLDPESD